ncbi:MAG: hypothetical protein ACK4Q5_02915 [Saprospiraceae bacterium]
MAYSQFTTLKAVKKQLSVSVSIGAALPAFEPLEPSDWLVQTMKITMARKIAYFSEKSRSEALVFPVLMELNARNQGAFALYSGAVMDADREKGLNGECDFILGLGKQNLELEAPVFCIVEAKDNDLDLGTPQCIAQMVGARTINEQDGLQLPAIYGAVTTGDTWAFLRLDGAAVTIEERPFYLAKTADLLGALQAIIDDCTGKIAR